MSIITSVANETVKDVCSLKTSKGRKELGQFVAEGFRTIQTFVQHGYKPVATYVVTEEFEKASNILDHWTFTEVNDVVMSKMSSATTPSGILSVFAIPEQLKPSMIQPGLVLAQINDPGNMGTLIRTAAAMNVKNIVVVEGTDPWSPKVVQSTAGALSMLSIFSWSWEELLQHKGALPLYALTVDTGEPLTDLLPKGLIVVGSEAHGLPSAWAETCTKMVTIPMPGKTESLNAAVAGSIALYLMFGK
jgi:TrmH family RNA methyltransferase